MTKVIEQLRQDHKNINRLLGLLEQQVNQFAAGEYTDYQIISDIMHYFVNYPDVYHHPHEDIVFAELKRKNIKVADQINAILAEHQAMAEESSIIHDEIKQIQGNAIFSRDEIVGRLRDYIARYHSHIEKEEKELFVQAITDLEADDWKKIDTEISVTDDPLFGKILDNEYTELYKMILSETKEVTQPDL